jgi:hypothetical protein
VESYIENEDRNGRGGETLSFEPSEAADDENNNS